MLEIACFEVTSAETACESMADRIEFCDNFELGGITPDFYEFMHLKRNYKTPVYVMIRPKGGPFFYSDDEFLQMKNSIITFKEGGADGFVFGILTSHNKIDEARNKQLIELAGDTPCTFHRAFDRTEDLEKSIQTLIKLGFKTVLTSGGKKSAMEGKEALKSLVQKYSDKIEILIGGGVRSENISELKKFTGGTSFHSSAILKYDTFVTSGEIKKLKQLSS
ncbi:copper homeostasis protein CutC [Kaistella flava (ex Peng et al. 2021)]|uniref:PF03932 family protein CutC n=1 Tax=Kaistella flava (ex Peng et al. 2021) TaxID=2038776 RepID=A0A7M2Y9I9_9FLAO|nr:copper homeostasis protein CutC [Kaistella flava (ex Peng et al. 2021)]QOW10811.1 copper homeostasis protein CutC [Kaistella flava (ex Peng et al. 2021)]